MSNKERAKVKIVGGPTTHDIKITVGDVELECHKVEIDTLIPGEMVTARITVEGIYMDLDVMSEMAIRSLTREGIRKFCYNCGNKLTEYAFDGLCEDCFERRNAVYPEDE